MAKSEARKRAYEIWQENDGEISLKSIADELGVSPSKVRKWKTLDKWNAPLKTAERSTKKVERNLKRRVPPELKKEPGAPYGNKNAEGNSGGKGAPLKNRNAETTGEYTQIYEDVLSYEELKIFGIVDIDPLAQIDKTIKLLTIRERRMLENINNLKEQKILAEYEDTLIPDKGDSYKIKSRKRYTKLLIDKIVLAEEALTRVQEKLIKAIDIKYKILREQDKETTVGNEEIVQIYLPDNGRD